MNGFRQHLSHNRTLAAALLTLALLMKILVPGGAMIGMSAGSMTIELCTGSGPRTMVVALPGGHRPDGQVDHRKADLPCAFAGLSAPSLGAVDPVLLVAAIAFTVVAALRQANRTVAAGVARFLRPPLRGPPVRR